jgi:hypothetical protein
MCIRNLTFLAICSAVMFSNSAIAKDIAIYRWVDENNVVHFSQHHPQKSNYSQLTTFASYKTKQQSAINKANKKTLVDEQLTQYETTQAVILEKNKIIAEKYCKAAQLNIKMLNSFSKVTILASDGKNRVLTDKEKKAQVILSNKHIGLYCDKNSG